MSDRHRGQFRRGVWLLVAVVIVAVPGCLSDEDVRAIAGDGVTLALGAVTDAFGFAVNVLGVVINNLIDQALPTAS